jgi:hypothetical protein
MNIRIKLAVAAALVAAVPAIAQIKINDNLSVTGWSVGSYQYSSLKGTTLTTGGATTTSKNSSFDSFNVDAALLGATITPTKDVTATFSMLYKPATEGGINGAPGGPGVAVTPGTEEVTLLDAYIAYAATDQLTITAGKYLSVLGYESFYPISDNMITLANQQFLAPIPGYHEGVKLDYAPDKTITVGVGLADTLYGPNATEGDGHFEHSDFGTEGYIQYTGVNNLTLWFGAGYNSKGPTQPHSIYVLDLWASYQIDKNSTVAVEEIYKDGGNVALNAFVPTDKGSNWLIYYQYNFTDKLSSWFGFSGEDVKGVTVGKVNFAGPRYWKASVSPEYAITANLYVKAQYSYIKYSSWIAKDGNFLGGEVGFKF